MKVMCPLPCLPESPEVGNAAGSRNNCCNDNNCYSSCCFPFLKRRHHHETKVDKVVKEALRSSSKD